MQLVLMVTARCNARCTHCSTSCGPDRTEHLSLEAIKRLIMDASLLREKGPLEVSITGGEPFLAFQQLKEAVAFGSSVGAVMSCVSNGYWASSPEKAVRLLRELKECGLALLAISTSVYHTEFVARQRVERALNAARDVGLECVLKFVRMSASDVNELCDWARRAGASRVELIPLMPTIRECTSLPDRDYERTTGLPEGTCPGAVINVAENSQAYMCCTPGAIRDFYTLGDVTKTSLEEVRNRFYLGAKQQVLRAHGPQYFAEAVKGAGLESRLRGAYTNICDLCTHIASDPQMAAVATRASEEYGLSQLRSLFAQRKEFSA